MTARLSRSEIDERARGFGFVLLSPYEQYESNETVLKWRCGANPAHTVDLTLGHLRRGCQECRQASRDAQRRYAEFDAVGEIVLAAAQGLRRQQAYDAVKAELDNGGVVLLTDVTEYGGLRSVVSYRLSEEESPSQATVLRLQRLAAKRVAARQGS